MTMNNIKDIYAIAKMTGSELAPMIVESESGESRKILHIGVYVQIYGCIYANYVLCIQESQG